MVKPLSKLFQNPETNILAEIGKTAALMHGVVDLSIGDPDQTTARSIIDAAYTAMKQGYTHYTASAGDPDYLQAVLKFHKDYFNLDYDLTNVRATAGASHALFIAMGAIIDPGDEVVILEPYFTSYKVEVEAFGGKPVFVQTKPENGFQPNLTELKAAVTAKTKAIIVNSPCNPTGAVFNQQTLTDIVTIARDADLYIFADEVYWPYVFGDNKFIPLESLAPERTIVTGSLSKVFAMTGFRIGYLLAPKPIIDAAGLLNEGVSYTPVAPSQHAGTFALNHLQEFMPTLQKAFATRLNYLAENLAKVPYLKVQPAAGSIYLFVDIRQSGLDDVAFSDYLLKEKNVLVIPGRAFGAAGNGFIRIAATQDMPELKKAVVAFQTLKLPQ
ncbi:aspartate aminotransferase [Agrilactobacillus composti DSM 18527 = JCM 14202]|uniref:Aminotransferase n=1 Tax=Agrilactobacillus composti DSM 18527 = JCM 14202 TaxID=1423734 RepID=X0PU17_9LACO|nr:aminotransferase class I/II-fold pyridoxal phosphate-dependent enzyme [Agrilactobacillus composti]KRM35959.1 aspartate aminotransferase [Agrilactobacillus composti DSM 18527 = JCM 14202]GAF41542.1 aspartate aminotransferase [Agrilactobacillus composti DSM 18527 = JCM 14202]